jgi:adenosylcobinamide-GDP ribazoletransferase
MLLAPLVAAIVMAPIALLGQWATGWANPWLIAVLIVASFTWITRAIHLDGLADTADALGSGQSPERALAIARQSDIGPFGVIAIVLALLSQVIAIATTADHIAVMLIGVAFASRIALVITCTPAFPAARPDGLGAAVAGSLRPVAAWLAVALGLAITGAVGWWMHSPDLVIATVAAILAGTAMAVVARRRLGGVTGDTMGATIEIAFTTGVVVFALSAG